MQVAGAQPVGSRGLSGLQLVVSEPANATRDFGARPQTPRAFLSTPHLMTNEPVVFPRDGLPLDQRPAQLRRAKAAARYQESEHLARHTPHTRRRR